MDLDTAKLIATFISPLVGTALGVFAGIKAAVNGMRNDVREMRGTLGEVRDYTRETNKTLDEYVKEGRVAMRKIDKLDEELNA